MNSSFSEKFSVVCLAVVVSALLYAWIMTLSPVEFHEYPVVYKPEPALEVEITDAWQRWTPPPAIAPRTEISATYEIIETAGKGEFTLLFYCPCVQCTAHYSAEHPRNIGNPYFVQQTASETIPTAGRTVAACPNVFPLGTEIYIVGFGHRIVEDKGGGIRGSTLDIFVDCHYEALQLGRRRAEVYVTVWNTAEEEN